MLIAYMVTEVEKETMNKLCIKAEGVQQDALQPP